MLRFAKDCLRERIGRIEVMIAEGALFQAGRALGGGRRCASLQACESWYECAEIHEDMVRRVRDRLDP